MRLDRALVERGLARSRAHAQELIEAGHVTIDGKATAKPALEVSDASQIVLADHAGAHYVSRAALKLVGALDACEPLGLHVAGKDALDAGASTGGFTQVLLERGIRHVTAIDVGHGQLAPSISSDPRVTSIEGLNVRDLTPDSPGTGAEVVVADLSFISLAYAIGPLIGLASPNADFLLMVKPQFEVGKQALGARGVVRDLRQRADAVAGVVAHMREGGLTIHNIEPSVLAGPAGNQEFFVWGSGSWEASGASAPRALDDAAITRAIAMAVERT